MRDLEGQTICVVGGTAGIGRAIAVCAVAAGAAVMIAGRTPARSAEVARKIGASGSGTVDLMDASSTADFLAAVGPVDHLVLTAAQVRASAFRDGEEAARFSFEGKFWAQHRCARLADVRRSILFCSGTLSRRAFPGTSALAAVNGAIEALGRALAVELAPVRVNVLSPGFVRDTDAYGGMPEAAREGVFADAASRLPVGLVGDPDSVAGPAVALLASPYATGVVLDIDGGGLLA